MPSTADSSWHTATLQWLSKRTGYKTSHLRVGVQVLLSWVIILAFSSPPAVWKKLSYSVATPTYALLVAAIGCQTSTGGSTLALLLGVFAALLGVGCSFPIIYITFAANGCNYLHSNTKGIVAAVVGSAFAGLLTVARFRLPSIGFGFVIAIFTIAVVVFAGFWYPTVQPKLAWYWLLQVALGLAVSMPVTNLILPLPAGRQVQQRLKAVLRRVAELNTSVLQIMAGEVDAESGLLKGCSGKEGSSLGIDSGLEAAVLAVHALYATIRNEMEELSKLLQFSKAEVNIYSRPHMFPEGPYREVSALVWSALNLSMMQLQALQHGRLRLALVQGLSKELRGMEDAVARCCAALGEVACDGTQFSSALEELVGLESAWGALDAAVLSQLGSIDLGGSQAEAAVTLRAMCGLVLTSASRVRSMFAALPAAISYSQPEAAKLAEAHFSASRGAWAGDEQALEHSGLKEGGGGSGGGGGATSATSLALRILQSAEGGQESSREMPLASADSKAQQPQQEGAGAGVLETGAAGAMPGKGGPGKGGPGKGDPDVDLEGGSGSKPGRAGAGEALSVERLSEGGLVGVSCGAWRRFSEATGLKLFHFQLGLQMAVSFGVAAVFTVNPNTFAKLYRRTVWILFTVTACFEPCAGGVLFKSFNRLAGTALGVGWSCVCIGLSKLINGNSYANTPGKFIPMTILVSIWGAWCAMNQYRFPKYTYTWFLAMVTVPLVAIAGLEDVTAPWKIAGYRAACICIGVVIDWAVSLLFVPVTTPSLIRQQTAAALQRLSTLYVLVVDQLLGKGTGEEALLTLDGRPTHESIRHILVQAFKVEASLSGIDSLSHLLPFEVFSFLTPVARRLTIGASAELLRTCQYNVSTSLATLYIQQMHATYARWQMAPDRRPYLEVFRDQLVEGVTGLQWYLEGNFPLDRAARCVPALERLQRQLLRSAALELQQDRTGSAAAVLGKVAAVVGATRNFRLLVRAVAQAFPPPSPGAAEAVARELGQGEGEVPWSSVLGLLTLGGAQQKDGAQQEDGVQQEEGAQDKQP